MDIREFLNSEDFFSMASKVVVQNDFFRKRKDTIYSNSFLYNDFERINKIKEIYEKNSLCISRQHFIFGKY